MARGIPNYYEGYGSSCDGGGGASGRHQYVALSSTSASSSNLRVDSFYLSSLDRGSIGDVFFGTDDISDTRDLAYKEDVLESYRRESEMKSLRRQSKKGSLLKFRCLEFLKFLCSFWRCIF